MTTVRCPTRVEARDLAYFPIGLLLQRGLAEERYDGCLRLIELLRRVGAPTFPEFEAAALLEQGRPDLARAIKVPALPRTRVRATLAAVFASDPRAVLVRDREGVLLGKAEPAADGTFEFRPERGVDPALVPVPAIDGLGSMLPARSVRLTVDRAMSQMALQAIGPYRGSIVVLDPTDGSVLAAVSDRRTAAEGGTPALEQMREPASIAKLVTVTAALRAGLDVDAILHDMTCRGSMRLGDGADDVLYCAAINGKLRGLDRALAVSCNVAFAELGEMVGREKLLEEFRRYGFDFDGEESRFFGRVVAPEGHAATARRSLDRARGDRDHAGARGARGGDGGERRLDASAALLPLDRHLPRVLGAYAAGARGLAGDRRELAAAPDPRHDRGRQPGRHRRAHRSALVPGRAQDRDGERAEHRLSRQLHRLRSAARDALRVRGAGDAPALVAAGAVARRSRSRAGCSKVSPASTSIVRRRSRPRRGTARLRGARPPGCRRRLAPAASRAGASGARLATRPHRLYYAPPRVRAAPDGNLRQHPRHARRHPAGPAVEVLAHRCAAGGEARVVQSGRLGQGPHRHLDDRSGRGERRAHAGHDHRRADLRQHRDRSRHRRRAAGLPAGVHGVGEDLEGEDRAARGATARA